MLEARPWRVAPIGPFEYLVCWDLLACQSNSA